MPRMKLIRSTPTAERKLARLVARAWLTLAWIGAALFGDTLRINRRYIRQRFVWLDLDRIARVVACLVIARAQQLRHRISVRPLRNCAAPGFTRRIRRGHYLRTVFGSALRKALKHPNLAQRFGRIVRALASIDRLARRIIHRLRRGMTRTCPVLAVRPPHTSVSSVAAAPAVPCADTS